MKHFTGAKISIKSPHSLAIILVLGIGLAACHDGAVPTPASPTEAYNPAVDLAGFARVTGPIHLAFPADHGPHPQYLTEWWYLTGNLETSEGRHFGYQLTFFRRALSPAAGLQPRPSYYATNQAYMAHFAITDVQAQTYSSFQRFERGAAGLAGSQAIPFSVWLDNWKLHELSSDKFQAAASDDDFAIDLSLTTNRVPVLQGNNGYSQKGPDPGNASIYYSLSHLNTTGHIHVGATNFVIQGLSWMDHEFSTSALSKKQVGWDWFSMQLNDGTDIMLFQLRRLDGTIDEYSSGTVVTAAGDITKLSYGEFAVQVTDTWKSPHSAATYPSKWAIQIPEKGVALTLVPTVVDQELNLAFTYWEGSVRISGMAGGKEINGYGYVELTGYAAPFSGDF